MTDDELSELRRYVNQVERLASCSFFENPGGKLTISSEIGKPVAMEHAHAGDEAMRAVVPIFRQLYTDTAPASAARVMSIIKQSAHRTGTEEGRELIALLRDHARLHKELRAGNGGMSLVHDGSPIDNAGVIDLWLNGEYMHWDEDKAAVLEAWPEPIMRFQLNGAVVALRNAYWVLANLVRRVLAAPAILPR